MRRTAIVTWCVLGVFAVQACATAGHNFPSGSRTDIVLGRPTESQLLDLFGEPFAKRSRTSDSLESVLCTWTYGEGGVLITRARQLTVELVGGRVNGWLFFSSLEEDDTDFDTSARLGLQVRRSRLEDARALLGPTDGEVRLPTNLLHDQFGSMQEVMPPEGATQAVVYKHVVGERKDAIFTRRLKLLVLFAAPDDTITAIRWFDGTL